MYMYIYCKWQQPQLMKWIAACLSKPDANWINPCLKWFAIPSSTKRSPICFPHDASYKCNSLDPTGTGYGWALRCFPRKLQGHPGPIGGPCHLAQLWLEVPAPMLAWANTPWEETLESGDACHTGHWNVRITIYIYIYIYPYIIHIYIHVYTLR